MIQFGSNKPGTKVDCYNCGGDGYRADSDAAHGNPRPCPACKGTGKIVVPERPTGS